MGRYLKFKLLKDSAVTSGPSLQLWLDASDTNTITATGDLVDTWADRSSNGNDGTASTTARPTTNVDEFNSNNSLRFDGGDVVNANSIASLMSGDDASSTIFINAALSNLTGDQTLCSFGNATNGHYYKLYVTSSGLVTIAKSNSGGGGVVFNGNVTITPSIPFNIAVAIDGTSVTLNVNGDVVTGTLNTSDTTFTKFSIGAEDSNVVGEYVTGNINEILVYDGALSTAELSALITAGETKWGTYVLWSDYDGTNDKTPVVFSAFTSTVFTYVSPIDDTRALVVYRATSNYCYAKIATRDSSGIVSYGSEATIISAAVLDIAVDVLDSTHAIICVESGGDVKAIAIEFSGTTISTVGTAATIETVNSSLLSVAALSSSDVLISYYNGTVCRLFYASVSGTTVTGGNGIDAFTGALQSVDITAMNSTEAMINIASNGVNPWSVLLVTFSGTTPSVTDTLAVVAASAFLFGGAIKRIDDTHAIAAVTQSGSKAVVITNTSGTLSNGTVVTYDAQSNALCSIALPNASRAVITGRNNTLGMRTTVIEIAGAVLTGLTTYVKATDRETPDSCEVGPNFVLVVYEDDDNASYGTAQILTV